MSERHGGHGPAPRPAVGGWHLAEWGSELAGTALLVFGGLSAVVWDFGAGSPMPGAIPSASARLLLTGLLFAGTGSLVAISPLGRLSGAHLNPSVTLAFYLQGHVHTHDLIGYWTSQFLGGIGGALALLWAWGPMAGSVHNGITQPAPGITPLAGVSIEGLMTAVLVLTIFAFVSSKRTAKWTPLAVWIVVAVLVWQGAPFTGTSLNPARSFGPALVSSYFHDLWVYFAGPLAGALLATLVWCLVPRSTLTAKLFHDHRYPSVLMSLLPARSPRRGRRMPGVG